MSETDKSSTPPLGPPHPSPNEDSEMSSQSHIAIYHSHSMSHVQQPQSSHPMPSTLYPSHPHWQYAQTAYPNQNAGVYYQPTNQVVHSGAIPAQYPTSYQGWSGPLPIHPSQQEQVSQTQYFDPDSLVSNRESGPSRTKRQRRRSAQDPMGIVEGDTSDRPETPPSSSSSKRTKPGSSASATVETKSFSCSLCSATFTRKGDCLRHTRSVHTRETPYDCQGCGELFTRSDMRGKHWKMDPQCEKTHWREVMTASGRANLLEPDA